VLRSQWSSWVIFLPRLMSWWTEHAQVFNHSGLKKVAEVTVLVLLFSAGRGNLCHCTCLAGGSTEGRTQLVDKWLWPSTHFVSIATIQLCLPSLSSEYVSMLLYVCCRISCWINSTKNCTLQTWSISLLRRAPTRHRALSCRSLTDAARESLDHQSAKDRYLFSLIL